MSKRVGMPLNQYETLMSQAADKLAEYQDLIARVKRALDGPHALQEIREILK